MSIIKIVLFIVLLILLNLLILSVGIGLVYFLIVLKLWRTSCLLLYVKSLLL